MTLQTIAEMLQAIVNIKYKKSTNGSKRFSDLNHLLHKLESTCYLIHLDKLPIMRFQSLLLLFAAVAAAAATETDHMGPGSVLEARDEMSPLEARFDACNRRCHNGKGHCPNKDRCKKQCHKCVNGCKAICLPFFPSFFAATLKKHFEHIYIYLLNCFFPSLTLLSLADVLAARLARDAVAVRRDAAIWIRTRPLRLVTFLARAMISARNVLEFNSVGKFK